MMKKREANVELLRLITMLMIVMGHLINHGELIYVAREGSVSYNIAWGLFGLTIPAVDIYVLISGYFLVESKFSSWKLFKLAIQVWFYTMTITLYFWISGSTEHVLKEMVYSLTPIISDFYWFITMYVGMYILSPLLNHFVKSLSKRQLQCVLALCFVLFSVWTNIFYYTSGMNIAGGISITWFVVLYMFGAYIRLYDVGKGSYGKWMLWGIILDLLIPISRVVIVMLNSTPLEKLIFLDDLLWGYSVFYQYNSMLALGAAVCLFVGFLGVKIKSQRISGIILLFASTSLGVYLIHEHGYIREALWNKVGACNWLGKWYLLPRIITTTLAVYVVCSAVELLRRFLFRPIERNEKLQEKFRRIDMKLKGLWNGDADAP
ncbi:MAG: acyltransferase [Butyrivibrio sp.]|nr:acyltransferase [Butyrivibrio sp.]